MSDKIVLVANTSWYLYNFRFNLIKELIKKNKKVIIICTKDKYIRELQKLNIKIYSINFKNKFFFFFEIFSFLKLFLILLYERPHFFLGFTIKPNIYGLLSGFFLKTKFINTITGLGTFYLRESILKFIILYLYKLALQKSNIVIFQNIHDKKYFIEKKLVNLSKTTIVPGSGVDLTKFKFSKKKFNKNLNFYFFGRLIADKGIYELIEAIQRIKKEYSNVNFFIVGNVDNNNYSSIKINTIINLQKKKILNYLGFKEDIYHYIKKADCIILPSYREGLSKILIETCAVGRPAITTNVAGCKEIINHGMNGYLCKPKNSFSLYLAIKKFIELPVEKKLEFCLNSNQIAKNFYSDKIINNKYLEILEL